MRQQADKELVIKVKTGAALLDRLIAQKQGAYSFPAAPWAETTAH
jgi:hypothetical protein